MDKDHCVREAMVAGIRASWSWHILGQEPEKREGEKRREMGGEERKGGKEGKKEKERERGKGKVQGFNVSTPEAEDL